MFMLGQMSSFALVTMVELLKLKVGRAALIRAHGWKSIQMEQPQRLGSSKLEMRMFSIPYNQKI